jgi:hypothetical protein
MRTQEFANVKPWRGFQGRLSQSELTPQPNLQADVVAVAVYTDAVALANPARRMQHNLPGTPFDGIGEKHFDPAARSFERSQNAGLKHSGVIEYKKIAAFQVFSQVQERGIGQGAGRAVRDQQSRPVARADRLKGDLTRREVKVEVVE